jgi:hypothetical protein
MERDKNFDGEAFLDLLGEVMTRRATGIVSVRIHVRDGMPWAVSVQFDSAAEKAA